VSEFYVNGDKAVRLDNCNRFIYEVMVNVYYDNIFSMVNHKYFTSETEIPNVIESYYVTPSIEICCEMYSAPKSWLNDNDFILYVKPEKKSKQKIKTDK
jgi:hypothetical protein